MYMFMGKEFYIYGFFHSSSYFFLSLSLFFFFLFLKALNKDSMKLSTRLSMLDQELCDKGMQLQDSTTEDKTDILEKIQVLQKERDQLLRRRNSVDEKLKEGN